MRNIKKKLLFLLYITTVFSYFGKYDWIEAAYNQSTASESDITEVMEPIESDSFSMEETQDPIEESTSSEMTVFIDDNVEIYSGNTGNILKNDSFIRTPGSSISNWKTTLTNYTADYPKDLFGLSQVSRWQNQWYESKGRSSIWFSSFGNVSGLGVIYNYEYEYSNGLIVIISQTVVTKPGQRYRLSANFDPIITNQASVVRPEAQITAYNGTASAGGGALVNVLQQLPAGIQGIKLQDDFTAKSDKTTIGIRMKYKGDASYAGLNASQPILLEHMKVDTDPNEYNVYADYDEDFSGNYWITNIPAQGNTGTVNFTYPDESQSTEKYTADADRKFERIYSIPRDTLPANLQTEAGSVKTYETNISAVNETMIAGIPSEEYKIPINVYNLGAEAIPQFVKKGESLEKKPQDLVRNEVILPGHTASYEYESELPDTSTVGLKSVLVRMTDKEQPEQTKVIKVPVQVLEDAPPSEGLYLGANDFTKTVEDLIDLSELELEEFILKNSEAVGWDVASGSTDDTILSVSSTNLKPNAKLGVYNATIKATKGTFTTEKKITITITDKQEIDIAFLDETNEKINENITLIRDVGSTLDLSKEEEVQKVIAHLIDKKYQVSERPENEMAFIVPENKTTLEYHFKGTLFISSHPNSLNFGRKMVMKNSPFIRVEKAKYDLPLIIWDSRKGNNNWSLVATLEKPLTNVENSNITLPNAIRYKVNEAKTVILTQGSTEIVASQTIKDAQEYNISKEWDSGKSGLQLEVPTREVLEIGRYKTTILWQLSDCP